MPTPQEVTSTASGIFSLQSNTTGSYNTAFGYNAKASTDNATNQTVIGCEATGQADNSVVLGNEDVTAVYMGEDSGATVYAASFVGDGSQLTGITGSASSLNDLTDVLVDSNSMFLGNPPTNSTGGYNTASGRNALNSNTTGDNNTASGYYALYLNTTGDKNTASGSKALYHNTDRGRKYRIMEYKSLYDNTDR